MLAQKFRFHGHGSLRYVYSRGDIVRSRAMAIKFVVNQRREQSRVTVVVSRKVMKSAPKRNRIRRRIYEVFRINWLNIKPGQDIAAIVYEPRFYDMPQLELEETILDLLKRANLWQDIK